MRTMYDAVTPGNVPTDAQMVAGYIDGHYESYAGLVARCPNAVHVSIAVSAGTNAGQVLDVEQGDATPWQAPGWCQARRAAGQHPTVYCSLAEWDAVRAAFRGAGVAEPEYWIAAYPGNGANLYSGSVAHQYDSPGPYDVSVVADFWPGVDGAGPSPQPKRRDEPMRVTDKSNGAVWLIGVGYAYHIPGPPNDYVGQEARLAITGTVDAGVQDPLVVCQFMQDHGAWDYSKNQPRTV